MSLNFPSDPSVGQRYVYGNSAWQWNGTAWDNVTGGSIAYKHDQEVASSSWNIVHNLGFYPNITIQDSAGTTVEGEIAYQSVNAVQINFGAAFSGTAYLS